MRLIFLDTETPNQKNDRVCEIGIVVKERREILFEKAWLVNPETHFDAQNMEIHKISKQDILDAPIFPEVWKKILAWVDEDTVFVMHNAQFDLNVIYKTLSAYKLSMPALKYYCTMKKSAHSGVFKNAKLDEMMKIIGKKFTHHEALNDAKACSEIYDYLANHVGWNDKDMSVFKPNLRNNTVCHYGSDFYHAIKNLEGILQGIVSDGIIQDAEVDDLKNWLIDNACHRTKLGFADCLEMVSRAVQQPLDIRRCKAMYDWLSMHEENCHENTYCLEEWHGILRGIIADGVILRSELSYLIAWMEQHNWIDSNADDIYEACLKVYAHIGDNEELSSTDNQELIDLFKSELTDENSKDLFLEFNHKVCCLTGTFFSGRKSELEARIAKAGGSCGSSVTTCTNYVFVGGEGSRQYCAGNHGTKINKALELKARGQDIDIFEEKILLASLAHLKV